MPNFIDRRLNPRDKSLGNRQRFLRRARSELKRAINERVKSGKIETADSDQMIAIPKKGIGEPTFQRAPHAGRREEVLPGNKVFGAGDRIPRPAAGTGKGSQPSASGESEDDFQFALTREEVLDLFFEDLELPDLVKLNLKEVVTFHPRRAGYTMSGNPTSIAVARTMFNSFGRRIALKRPKQSEIDAINDEIAKLEGMRPNAASLLRIEHLRDELATLMRRRKFIPYIDPIDIRFKRFEPQPEPNANAVMFCLMDVSGSMGEREKDLAKRFFVLLHLFLKRRYERTDIVFIRHTHEASEVDEDTFFYSTQSGGTVVSTALEEMLRVIRERYPSKEWNIYAAQASDGDNIPNDSERCVSILHDTLMSLCQYYAYVEIIDERESEMFRHADNGTSLWNAYRQVQDALPNFAMTRIAKPADIYPVFHELFAKQPGPAKRR